MLAVVDTPDEHQILDLLVRQQHCILHQISKIILKPFVCELADCEDWPGQVYENKLYLTYRGCCRAAQ